MRIYISGPITGRKSEEYLRHFAGAERFLKLQGFDPVNPAEMNLTMPESTTHEQYMKVSIAALETCDMIYMLKGWTHFEGAKQEFCRAAALSMPCMYEEDRNGRR